MTLPFTQAEFLDVFVRYNTGVWPAQIALIATALVALALLFERPGRALSALLAVLWLWTGVAYHLAYFADVNPAAPFFAALFVAGAAVFAWEGVVRARLAYQRPAGARGALGIALVAYALAVYPMLALGFGRGYPAMPTFGTPCPTVIFTIGVLACLRPPCPPYVLLAPLLWAAIGSQAALLFGVYEDLGLAVAGVLAAMLAIRCLRRAAA